MAYFRIARHGKIRANASLYTFRKKFESSRLPSSQPQPSLSLMSFSVRNLKVLQIKPAHVEDYENNDLGCQEEFSIPRFAYPLFSSFHICTIIIIKRPTSILSSNPEDFQKTIKTYIQRINCPSSFPASPALSPACFFPSLKTTGASGH
jgi:hypothetical protein